MMEERLLKKRIGMLTVIGCIFFSGMFVGGCRMPDTVISYVTIFVRERVQADPSGPVHAEDYLHHPDHAVDHLAFRR